MSFVEGAIAESVNQLMICTCILSVFLPCSALDARSEKLVQQALEKLMVNRTVLTIAHRLSTIRSADQIVVLKHGAVAEQGTYDDLIKRQDGHFRNLVYSQYW